ncbi:MAG: DUF4493 domain-containing protein [Bacteroidales bacterium]|nr:DUF4493 domain-containing protein [Bacteroidales bacterium]
MLVFALTLYSCSESEMFDNDEVGNLVLKLSNDDSINNGSGIIVRSNDETDISQYLVTIRQNNVVRLSQKYNTLTSENLFFKAGANYYASAQNCDDTEAENDNNLWGRPRYFGESESFDIVKSKETSVEINCSMINSKASVSFDSSMAESFSDYKITLYNNDNRKLVFDSNSTVSSPIAYFNVGENMDITYLIEATGKSSQQERRIEGTVKNNLPAKWIKISVKTTPSGSVSVNAVSIDNTVDDNQNNSTIDPY